MPRVRRGRRRSARRSPAADRPRGTKSARSWNVPSRRMTPAMIPAARAGSTRCARTGRCGSDTRGPFRIRGGTHAAIRDRPRSGARPRPRGARASSPCRGHELHAWSTSSTRGRRSGCPGTLVVKKGTKVTLKLINNVAVRPQPARLRHSGLQHRRDRQPWRAEADRVHRRQGGHLPHHLPAAPGPRRGRAGRAALSRAPAAPGQCRPDRQRRYCSLNCWRCAGFWSRYMS